MNKRWITSLLIFIVCVMIGYFFMVIELGIGVGVALSLASFYKLYDK